MTFPRSARPRRRHQPRDARGGQGLTTQPGPPPRRCRAGRITQSKPLRSPADASGTWTRSCGAPRPPPGSGWRPGALFFADVYAGRQDRVACLANLCQAVLATAQGRLAAAGEWVLNEKRLTERAGFDAIQDRLAQPWPDLGALVSDVRARLGLRDGVWAGGQPRAAAMWSAGEL